jgi:predicted dehydrogenase
MRGGRDEGMTEIGVGMLGYAMYHTDWRRLVADPGVKLLDNGGSNDIHVAPCIAAAEAVSRVVSVRAPACVAV